MRPVALCCRPFDYVNIGQLLRRPFGPLLPAPQSRGPQAILIFLLPGQSTRGPSAHAFGILARWPGDLSILPFFLLLDTIKITTLVIFLVSPFSLLWSPERVRLLQALSLTGGMAGLGWPYHEPTNGSGALGSSNLWDSVYSPSQRDDALVPDPVAQSFFGGEQHRNAVVPHSRPAQTEQAIGIFPSNAYDAPKGLKFSRTPGQFMNNKSTASF